MSEFTNTQNRGFRRKLLMSVSALALAAFAEGLSQAAAADADRPTVWIEAGWQFEQYSGQGDLFTPPFTIPPLVASTIPSPLSVQKMSVFSSGAEGSISFQPETSSWIFSGSFRYGRAGGSKHLHMRANADPVHAHLGSNYVTASPTEVNFVDAHGRDSEAHIIADFQVGKDVGLGMFGGSSIVKVGVRFAQLKSNSTTDIDEIPDEYFPTNLKYAQHRHRFSASADIDRNFRGVGPSIAWSGDAPLAGNSSDGQITLDWGANAALLFGRQKVKGHHQTTSQYYRVNPFAQPKYYHVVTTAAANPARSKTVTVSNLGGFAGLSFRYPNAKLSVGYRGDFFFGAIDSGIHAAHKQTRGFYGPFATISFGIGG